MATEADRSDVSAGQGTQDCQEPPEARREAWDPEPPEASSPAEAEISDCWLPQL